MIIKLFSKDKNYTARELYKVAIAAYKHHEYPLQKAQMLNDVIPGLISKKTIAILDKAMKSMHSREQGQSAFLHDVPDCHDKLAARIKYLKYEEAARSRDHTRGYRLWVLEHNERKVQREIAIFGR